VLAARFGLWAALGGVGERILDLIFPKRCVQCGLPGEWLCAECATQLRSVEVGCRRCGRPSSRPTESCPECRGRELAFVGAVAAFVYEGPARRLVTACKFRHLRSLAREMARLAEPRFRAALPGAPSLVTCVPADRGRRLERGFNLAELLGRDLAAGAGVRFASVLVRERGGARQSTLSGERRRTNVAGAFSVSAEAVPLVRAVKRVVIVDDVYTTGETLNQCAHALQEIGCEVHAFTFARTVRRARPTVAETETS
jgi:ComF family protein